MSRAREIADLIGGTTPDIILKTADGAILNLQTSDTTVTDGSVLGKINFQAPNEGSGTDSILIAASIQAEAEGTFSASNNATSVIIYTGESEAAETDGGGKFTFDSFGQLFLKNTSNADNSIPALRLETGDTDIAADDLLGRIMFTAPDEGAGTDAIALAAEINAISEGNFSSSNNATTLQFATGLSGNASVKMTLSSAGFLSVTGGIKSQDFVEIRVDDAELYFSNTANNRYARFKRENNHNDIDLAFFNGSSTTDRFKFRAAGDLQVLSGNVVIGTGGKGIDFSAQTQSSSTTTSELLDHYEEGTWSPAVTDIGGNDATMGSVRGKYIRIGTLVIANYGFNITSKGSMTGNFVFVKGIPFNHSGSNAGTGPLNRFSGLASAVSSLSMEIGGSITNVAWFTDVNGTGGTADGYLSVAQISASFFAQGTLIYSIV